MNLGSLGSAWPCPLSEEDEATLLSLAEEATSEARFSVTRRGHELPGDLSLLRAQDELALMTRRCLGLFRDSVRRWLETEPELDPDEYALGIYKHGWWRSEQTDLLGSLHWWTVLHDELRLPSLPNWISDELIEGGKVGRWPFMRHGEAACTYSYRLRALVHAAQRPAPGLTGSLRTLLARSVMRHTDAHKQVRQATTAPY
jgi:hypothetical protein